MSNYIKMYHTVSNAATDALGELEGLNIGQAKALLRSGNQGERIVFAFVPDLWYAVFP